jgi:predicted ester cyclase
MAEPVWITLRKEQKLSSVSLADQYRAYIACLNKRDWNALAQYVDDDVEHNGRPLKLSGYRDMLIKDFADIPDLHFNIELLSCSPPLVAARLSFKCSPRGRFLGLEVNGRTVCFAENVFYAFKLSKIVSVWSVIDKMAIETQLSSQGTNAHDRAG